MTRKITEAGSVRGSVRTESITSSVAVDKADKAESVGHIIRTQRASGASRVASVGTRITESNREDLIHLVDEEVEKLFPAKSTTSKRRQSIESAVKMAINASVSTEE